MPDTRTVPVEPTEAERLARVRAFNARQHAIALEQCSIFVSDPPLAKAMTEAAAFLREITKAAPPPSDRGARALALLRQAVALLELDPEWDHPGTDLHVLRYEIAALIAEPADEQ